MKDYAKNIATVLIDAFSMDLQLYQDKIIRQLAQNPSGASFISWAKSNPALFSNILRVFSVVIHNYKRNNRTNNQIQEVVIEQLEQLPVNIKRYILSAEEENINYNMKKDELLKLLDDLKIVTNKSDNNLSKSKEFSIPENSNESSISFNRVLKLTANSDLILNDIRSALKLGIYFQIEFIKALSNDSGESEKSLNEIYQEVKVLLENRELFYINSFLPSIRRQEIKYNAKLNPIENEMMWDFFVLIYPELKNMCFETIEYAVHLTKNSTHDALDEYSEEHLSIMLGSLERTVIKQMSSLSVDDKNQMLERLAQILGRWTNENRSSAYIRPLVHVIGALNNK